MTSFIALLRGVNVGGNGLLPMTALREKLSSAGYSDVRTYIQSGNVLFNSSSTNTLEHAANIQAVIQKFFDLKVGVVVFSGADWQSIINSAPGWWDGSDDYRHNLLVMIPPFNMDDTVAALGELKPDIESVKPGAGVLYESHLITAAGRTNLHKLISKPAYKKMTIRNYNTATKLAVLLQS